MSKGICMQHKEIRVGRLFLTLCFILGFTISCSRFGDDPDEVAAAFLESMMENDAKGAKKLTSPKQWDRIDTWIVTHLPLKCTSREWETGTGGVGLQIEGDDSWSFTMTFQCVDDRNPQCFSIDDIVIERVADGWQVVEWGRICEEQDFCYKCP